MDQTRRFTQDQLLAAVTEGAEDYGFTPRQLDILLEVIDGAPTSEAIADALGVSLSTVKNHMTEMLRKTASLSRTDLLINVLTVPEDEHPPDAR